MAATTWERWIRHWCGRSGSGTSRSSKRRWCTREWAQWASSIGSTGLIDGFAIFFVFLELLTEPHHRGLIEEIGSALQKKLDRNKTLVDRWKRGTMRRTNEDHLRCLSHDDTQTHTSEDEGSSLAYAVSFSNGD